MIDVHCHMLPGIDDGSKNVDMSLEMIKMSADQGVTGICFTPHFYADMNSPEEFTARRDNALKLLESRLGELPVVPDYTVGAEVHYFRGISRSSAIERLCIGKSNYILIEMPFRTWQPYIIEEIEELSEVSGMNIIIAHIERYLDQDKKLVRRIIDNPNLLKQCNAEFFIERTAGKAFKMLKRGEIDLLGSDSHNLGSRHPNLIEASDIIEKKFRKDVLSGIWNNGRMILDSAKGW